MSKIDYQALRAKAEKATSGVWSLEYGEGRFDGDDALIHREVAGYIPICRIEGAHPESGFDEDFQMEQQANAEFIAAASPATVLALLDERERNQQYIKSRDQENEDIALTVGRLRVELEAAENNLIDSECHVAELEEALRDKQALLEASEQRITELESLTAPKLPQPAVPDKATWRDAPVNSENVDWAAGWNACRAAMLKSFGNSEQLDEVGSWNNHRNTPTAQDGNYTEQNLDMVDHFGDATQKAMLHGSEPETDNTNQQFESLSRGDK